MNFAFAFPQLSDSLLAAICLLLLLVGLGSLIIILFILRSRRSRPPKLPPLRSQILPGQIQAMPQPRQALEGPPTPAYMAPPLEAAPTSIPSPQEQGMIVCPHCQQPIRPGRRFCPQCGNPLIPSNQVPLQSGPVRASLPPASQPPGMPAINRPSPPPITDASVPRICQYCQHQIRPGARFCPGCGKPVT
jgi:RNA polymerase subunit RPABC4/transcription elongation factor Spt4